MNFWLNALRENLGRSGWSGTNRPSRFTKVGTSQKLCKYLKMQIMTCPASFFPGVAESGFYIPRPNNGPAFRFFNPNNPWDRTLGGRKRVWARPDSAASY